MKEILLSFARTNDAIQAENILLAAGIPAGVMNLPSAIQAGCGICLRVAPEQLAGARACLRQSGTPVAALYTRTTEGAATTYAPLEAENE